MWQDGEGELGAAGVGGTVGSGMSESGGKISLVVSESQVSHYESLGDGLGPKASWNPDLVLCGTEKTDTSL